MKKINIEKLIQDLVANLEMGKPVRKKLPKKGILHIDRKLPFLFIYRQPVQSEDKDTERLIRAEAAFLIASGDPQDHEWLNELISRIVETFSEEFGAFILIEISSMHGKLEEGFDEGWRPSFKVNVPDSGPSYDTVEALEGQLKKVKVFNKLSKVDISKNSAAHPQNHSYHVTIKMRSKGVHQKCSKVALSRVYPPIS